MNFKIEKVYERDIDLLLIDKFINSNLLDYFLEKVNETNYELFDIEHSFIDEELGESDVTIIITNGHRKIGLLIEDKIDAPAMDLQPERYIERGHKGVINHLYDDFKTIIVAPEQYLNSNPFASKYQFQISYEEIVSFLYKDLYAVTLLNKAIEEKKKGYIIVENKMITKFWDNYYRFIKEKYPSIRIHEVHGPRGNNALWPEIITDYKQVKIIHKSDRGYMDLTFSNMANYVDIFYKYIDKVNYNLKIVPTGKSLAIRLNVPVVDFRNDFEYYINEMNECMESVLKLYEILSSINVLLMYEEVNKN